MNLSAVSSNQQFKTAVIVAGVFSAAYIFINLFVIGGDAFVISLNNNLTVPLGLITLYFSFKLWQKVGTAPKSHALWRHMIAGWALWTLAEILWAIFSIVDQEVPYPSWADLFWLVGYIPLGLGLFARARSLPLRPNTGQQLAIWGASVATILFSLIFVVWPILQNTAPQPLLESILNIIYPIADLFLLIVVFYLFFAYEQGAYGLGWRVILTGFILHWVSNQLFSFASASDLYFPNSQANLLSTLGVDVPYNLSYVFWIVGIYLLSLLFGEHQPFQLDTMPKLVPNTHMLIFTKKDGTIIDVSHNFSRWFAAEEVKGKTIGEVLGLTSQEETLINEKLRVLKKLVDQPVQVKLSAGERLDAWLCGMAIMTTQGEQSGANFLLRGFSSEGSLDGSLSESEKSVVRYLLNQKISTENSQVRQLLLDYYLSQIKLLYNLAFQEGGATLSQSLLDELQAAAQKSSWQMQLIPQTILDGDHYSMELLQSALPAFLKTAKQFVAEMTEVKLVETRLQTLNAQMGEAVLQNVAQFSTK